MSIRGDDSQLDREDYSTDVLSRRAFLVISASSVAVSCAPDSRAAHGVVTWGGQGTRDGQFMRPRAIGVRDGRVYVVDMIGRVQAFTRDGEFVRGWRMPEYDNGTPTCVSFARDGRVLLPDTHYSRIAEFTRDGELIRMWGEYGNAPGNFIYPTGIVESAEGEYFISEYGDGTERVQVFGADREYRRGWGSHGTEPGQFNRAMAIAMTADGAICVADTTNHRLQLFEPSGALVRVIGRPGTNRGELKFPHDIDIAPDGSILACEYGANRVSRYSAAGECLGLYGAAGRAPGQFAAPRGVAVSEDGDVFVADTENHRVQRFRLEAVA